MMPIVFVIYYQNLIFFSLLISVVCLGAFYEWIKNNLDNKVLGLFVILNFGICSIIFIVLQDGKIISPYLLYLLIILIQLFLILLLTLLDQILGKHKLQKKRVQKNHTKAYLEVSYLVVFIAI